MSDVIQIPVEDLETFIPCDHHPDEDAHCQCGQCGKKLCRQCLDQDAHFYFCRSCGTLAQRIIKVLEQQRTAAETLDSAGTLLRSVALALVNHVVVPAALILMVGSFLFYLLDVRSVYWRTGDSLRQIGFFFVMATVLIARYGKVYELRKRQSLYTGILAVATLIAMLKQPGIKGLGAVTIIVVVFLVWRFATSVTNKLDLVEEEQEAEDERLYGVARIHHEEMEGKYNLQPDRYTSKQVLEKNKRKKDRSIKTIISGHDAHGNPAAAVAKLAGLAIFVFALGEPAILSGAPEIGIRALAAVIVFLLSTGIVLAAASAAGTFKHAADAGGKPSLGMVPGKIFLAVLLLITILAAGLTVPGLQYEGSGKITAKTLRKGTGRIQGKNKENQGSSQNDDMGKETKPVESRQGEGGDRGEKTSGGESPSPAQGLFNIFSTLGKLLLIPLLICVACGIIYGLFKLGPLLKGVKFGLMDRLRELLKKLRGKATAGSEAKEGDVEVPPDPEAAMQTLGTLPPLDVVLTAYGCFLGFLNLAGHKVMTRLTPNELLSTLPEDINRISRPAQRLTDLYLAGAYSNVVPTPQESREAQEAIRQIRNLLNEPESIKKT